MANFILELLSEEIPSRMQKQASIFLLKQFEEKINFYGVNYEDLKVFFSSRRLSIIIYNIADFFELEGDDCRCLCCKKKKEDTKKGKQFSKQPKKIAKKTAKYRKGPLSK